jgi:hypothetical protein
VGSGAVRLHAAQLCPGVEATGFMGREQPRAGAISQEIKAAHSGPPLGAAHPDLPTLQGPGQGLIRRAAATVAARTRTSGTNASATRPRLTAT